MISIKQILYALAVEKTLHFKKASQLCNVSQSALSTALSEMEKMLGFQVFERDNKKVLITSLGRIFLEKARLIKQQINDIEKLSCHLKEPLSYPMSIGMIPTIGPYILPKILPSLNTTYPALKLNVIEEQSHVLLEMVKKGDIDTAILALPYECENLLTFEFWNEDFYWVTHRDDALGKHTEISSEQVDASKLMLLKDGHCLKEHALAACQLSPHNTNHSLGATSLHTLIQLVVGKMGSTLVPRIALDQLINNNPELVSVHLKEPGPHRRIAFIVRPNYSGLDDIQRLMTLFKKQLS